MNERAAEILNIDEQVEPYLMMVSNMKYFLELQEKLLLKIQFYEEWKLGEWQNRVSEKRKPADS